jgi:hypothetical protein
MNGKIAGEYGREHTASSLDIGKFPQAGHSTMPVFLFFVFFGNKWKRTSIAEYHASFQYETITVARRYSVMHLVLETYNLQY